MQFGLSQEQRQLRDALTRLLETHAPLDRVRRAAEGDRSAADPVHAALGELGLPGLLVPEDSGGLGLGMLDVVVSAEALGAHVAPVPFVAPYVIAPVALRHGASPEQQGHWLPRIVTGETRFAVGLGQRTGARGTEQIRVEGGRIRGESTFTLDVEGATDYLVADASGGLHAVRVDDPWATSERLTTVDRTRTFAVVRFGGAAAETLPGSDDSSVLERCLQAGRIALAADTLGAAQTMLDRAVAYAKERRQFNRVIGSFQAVKHMCAEMAAALEPCRAMVWHAAHAYDEIPEEGPLLACHVKAHLSEVGQGVARTATEVHGGMGFTDLLGLHYWFKRIGVNRQALGGPEQLREEAARLQGWIENPVP